MKCQYCKKNLSTKSALKVHQNKTKYCLKLQGKNIGLDKYNCLYCDKSFTYKEARNRHHDKCDANTIKINNVKEEIVEIQNENIEYKTQVILLSQQLKDLQERYDNLALELAKRPTIQTNNTKVTNNNNIAVFDKSDQDIRDIIEEKYQKHHLLQGQRGVAKFTAYEILEKGEEEDPIYLVVDRSRCHGKYKLNDKIINDPGMKKLTNKVYPHVKRKACKIYRNEDMNDIEQEAFQEVVLMCDDNTKFRKEMSLLL